VFDFLVIEVERERDINIPIKESCLTKEAGLNQRTAIQHEGCVFWVLILKENEDVITVQHQ
jgi:hypothetical protein